MAPKKRQWSVVEREDRHGGMFARYYPNGHLEFTNAANEWFDGRERVDVLRCEDGAHALKSGDQTAVGRKGAHVLVARKGLALPFKTRMAVYKDGVLLVIDPNGDA